MANLTITSSKVVLDLMIQLVTELRRHFKAVERVDPCPMHQEVCPEEAVEAEEATEVTEVAKADKEKVVVVVVVEVEIPRFV